MFRLTHPDRLNSVPGTTLQGVLGLSTLVLWFCIAGICAMLLDAADAAYDRSFHRSPANTTEQ